MDGTPPASLPGGDLVNMGHLVKIVIDWHMDSGIESLGLNIYTI
jgi:hypothetical protein